MQLPEYGCQFLCERKSGNQLYKGCTKSGWPFIRFKLTNLNYVTNLFIYVLGTTVNLCYSSSRVVVTRTLERILFLDLGLAVTEKKV